MRLTLPFGKKATRSVGRHGRKGRLSGSIIVKGDFSAPEQRTYIVFGVPRGGTTMVGGVLRGLGLHMGDDLDPKNQEDLAFNLHAGATTEQIAETIAARNATHDVWGWKFPRAAAYLEDVLTALREPRLICVFRDSVSNAKGALGAAHLSEFERMRVHLNLTQRNFALLEKCGIPSLSISYEKAVANPRVFVEELGALTGHPPDFSAFDFEGFMSPGGYKNFDAYRKR